MKAEKKYEAPKDKKVKIQFVAYVPE